MGARTLECASYHREAVFSPQRRAAKRVHSHVLATSQFLHLSAEPTSHLLLIFLHLSHASGLLRTMGVERRAMTYLWCHAGRRTVCWTKAHWGCRRRRKG